MQQTSILITLTENDLESLITNAVNKAIEKYKLQDINQVEKPKKYLTRKEVADLLHVSLPTLTDWVKKGILKKLRIGSRVLFDREQVQEAIEKGSAAKYKRIY